MTLSTLARACALGILLLAASPVTAPETTEANAQNRYARMTCGQLWQARNAIYARRGYCFETERARRVFGPGCFPPYGRLSPDEQEEVSLIEAYERDRGCR